MHFKYIVLQGLNTINSKKTLDGNLEIGTF